MTESSRAATKGTLRCSLSPGHQLYYCCGVGESHRFTHILKLCCLRSVLPKLGVVLLILRVKAKKQPIK